MIIQEGLLISIFFAAILSFIVADKMVRAQNQLPLHVKGTDVQLQAANKNGRPSQIKSVITADDF